MPLTRWPSRAAGWGYRVPNASGDGWRLVSFPLPSRSGTAFQKPR